VNDGDGDDGDDGRNGRQFIGINLTEQMVMMENDLLARSDNLIKKDD
jgi:hypothetical protein